MEKKERVKLKKEKKPKVGEQERKKNGGGGRETRRWEMYCLSN